MKIMRLGQIYAFRNNFFNLNFVGSILFFEIGINSKFFYTLNDLFRKNYFSALRRTIFQFLWIQKPVLAKKLLKIKRSVCSVEGGATIGTTALVYYWIHSSFFTRTVQG